LLIQGHLNWLAFLFGTRRTISPNAPTIAQPEVAIDNRSKKRKIDEVDRANRRLPSTDFSACTPAQNLSNTDQSRDIWQAKPAAAKISEAPKACGAARNAYNKRIPPAEYHIDDDCLASRSHRETSV
jgi:hypothetical protein